MPLSGYLSPSILMRGSRPFLCNPFFFIAISWYASKWHATAAHCLLSVKDKCQHHSTKVSYSLAVNEFRRVLLVWQQVWTSLLKKHYRCQTVFIFYLLFYYYYIKSVYNKLVMANSFFKFIKFLLYYEHLSLHMIKKWQARFLSILISLLNEMYLSVLK